MGHFYAVLLQYHKQMYKQLYWDWLQYIHKIYYVVLLLQKMNNSSLLNMFLESSACVFLIVYKYDL